MMRRLSLVLLATFPLAIVASLAVAAQSPSASPSTPDRRVEVPKAGYAVTVPEGWTFEDSYLVSPDGRARCQPLASRVEEAVDDPSPMLERSAAFYAEYFEPVLIETSDIELPAGPAVQFVLDGTLQPGFMAGEARYGAIYLLVDGHTFLSLFCGAPERPEDDWLAIAETLEFLPMEDD